MGGVSDEEDPAVVIALSNLPRHLPGIHTDDLDVYIGPNGLRHQAGELVFVDGVQRLVGVDGLHVHPVGVYVVGDEHSCDVFVHHPVEQAFPSGKMAAQVRPEVNGHVRTEGPRAVHLDAQSPANAAASTVGRDDVLGVDLDLGATSLDG